MYDIRQFKPTLYVLLILGISGFALASQSPALWILTTSLILLNAWLIVTRRFQPMPRLIANAVTLIALVFIVMRIRAESGSPVLIIGQFLVLLQLIKLYEQRTNRDYAQLLVLSLLLMVAAAISTASLLFGLLLILYLFLSLYCCLLFHLKVEADHAKEAFSVPADKIHPATLQQDQRFLTRSMCRVTGGMAVIGIIVAILVFLFFPRGRGAGALGQFQLQPSQAMTGFSEQMKHQGFARIAQNEEIVATVKAWKDDKLVQGTQPLLLRAVTLDYYSGQGSIEEDRRDAPAWQWSRSNPSWDYAQVRSRNTLQLPSAPPRERWRQEITLKPTGSKVIFALAGPVSITPTSSSLELRYSNGDQTLRAEEPITRQLEYEVVSSNTLSDATDILSTKSDLRRSQIDPLIASYARRPNVSGVDANGRALAELREEAPGPQPLDGQIARNIERHLQTEFEYTLDLTDAKLLRNQDPLAAFLTELKRGHCEYFAGAMTLMCQSLGMQARVVLGFKCDEYNEIGNWYTIRQAHAHAWVEVRTPGGWWTYDPTSGRPTSEMMRQAGMWGRVKNLFNYLEFTWANSVVAYDPEDQENLIQKVEMSMTNSAISMTGIATDFRGRLDDLGLWLATRIAMPIAGLMIVILVGAVGWFAYERWMLRRRAQRIGLNALPTSDQLRLVRQLGFYDELMRLLERHHIVRPRHLTPLEFSDSLSFLPSEIHDAIGRLTHIFYRIRFGHVELNPLRQRRLASVVSRIANSMTDINSTK